MPVASVSVLVNGSPDTKFSMERGLRQCCQLSPILFNLVAEAFPILVHQFKDLGWVRGMRIQGGGERTSVLQYVDDTILFLGRSVDLDARLRRCLRIFSLISGLRINLHKSVVVVVGMDHEEVHRLVSSLGYQVGALPMKYLGLHFGSRRKDAQSWNRILEMVRARLACWRSKTLSLGGWLVLIRSVLSSLPVH